MALVYQNFSLERMDSISPNCIYVFILRIFKLGLLPGCFRKFSTELWPLLDVRISFLLNIFRTNGHSFVHALILTIRVIFFLFCKLAAVMTLDLDFYAHLAFYSMKTLQ